MFVSNTSTLVLLAKIGCLETFLESSPTIEIPVQVKKEALFEKDSFYARLIERLICEKKIIVVTVNDCTISKIMSQFSLDKGEAAAFVMYNNQKHKAILTDDGELIKLCKLEKVPFICAMAVVLRLFEKRKISKEESMNKFKELYTIGRYSESIYEHFKSEVK